MNDNRYHVKSRTKVGQAFRYISQHSIYNLFIFAPFNFLRGV